MILNDSPLQKLPVQVRVYLGSSNTLMAQHFLYGAQVGAAFHQVSGEGMPERMRANGFF